MTDRVAFANIGAEDDAAGRPRSREAEAPRAKLAGLFGDLVDDPPWPWLERARGAVP